MSNIYLILLAVFLTGCAMQASATPNTESVEYCKGESIKLPQTYFVFDTEVDSCGFVRIDDRQRLIDDILERTAKGQIIWLLSGYEIDSAHFTDFRESLLDKQK